MGYISTLAFYVGTTSVKLEYGIYIYIYIYSVEFLEFFPGPSKIQEIFQEGPILRVFQEFSRSVGTLNIADLIELNLFDRGKEKARWV